MKEANERTFLVRVLGMEGLERTNPHLKVDAFSSYYQFPF